MKIEKAVVLGDTHIPWHDKRAIDLTLKFIKDFRPDVLFLDGDIMDFFEISRFIKMPSEGIDTSLQAEVNSTYEILKAIRAALPKNSKIYYIFGNHEHRLQKYIVTNAESLHNLKQAGGNQSVLSLQFLLQLKELKIVPIYSKLNESYMEYGDILIGHWDIARKYSGYTGRNLMAEKDENIIQGHVHRLALNYRSFRTRTLVAIENGCLCNLDPCYKLHPDWQQGFAVLFKMGNKVYPTIVHIDNYKFFFGGKLYYGPNQYK